MSAEIIDTKIPLRPRTLGFFSDTNLSPSAAPKQKQLTNLGGLGDCGFRSLAAAIVDMIRANYPSSRANIELWKTLSSTLLDIYPDKYALPSAGLWTPIQHLDRMRQKPEFIVDLAFILRQKAVDEMVKYPEKYRGVILTDGAGLSPEDRQTSPKKMRKPGTWIDETAIAAVANALSIPITVRVTEANKELFKPLEYGPDENLPNYPDPIEIRLEGKHYQAMLLDGQLFEQVKNQSLGQVPDTFAPNDPSLDSLIERTKLADKELANKFMEYCDALQNLADEGRLDKTKLLAIYIQGVNKQGNSGYLKGRVREVGIEHGNQDFFERALNSADADVVSIRTDLSDGFECIVEQELRLALARALTIGDLVLDDVYAHVEGNRQSLGA